MVKRIALLLLVVVAACFTPSGSVSAETVKKDNFTKIRDLVMPKPAEIAWRDIPWRATYWDAVCDAQKEDKPIMLFAMNGHPMGCT